MHGLACASVKKLFADYEKDFKPCFPIKDISPDVNINYVT